MEIQRGGRGARTVWATQELRYAILDLLDNTSLVSMFRLEKAVIASVAALVYKEVHVRHMRKFNRQNVSLVRRGERSNPSRA